MTETVQNKSEEPADKERPLANTTEPPLATSEGLPEPEVHYFRFTGDAIEYFKIWIVNLCLTILTLGIYSAWAKVRTNRYFYSHTHLNAASFEYLADPVTILKGRLIAVVVFIIYALCIEAFPPIQFAFMLAFLIALPWLVVKTMQFRARNSAYRNIRFNFEGNYRESANVFIGGSFLTGLTLGLAYPYFLFMKSRFLVEKTNFGKALFQFGAKAREFYRIYLLPFAIFLIVGILPAIVIPMIASYSQQAAGGTPEDISPAATNAIVFLPMIIMPIFLLLFIYIETKTTNLILSNVTSTFHRLECGLEIKKMAMLYFTNIIGILLSFGLLVPWAMIRTAKYRVESMTLHIQGGFDEFLASENVEVSGTAEGMTDVFDLDIGL